jgi:hypothetical protein
MSGPPAGPPPAPGPAARAVQGLVVGRLRGWGAVPFALLGAAGLAVSWTNLSTFVGYERLKKAATAETRARVSELYFEVLPPGAAGPVIGGQTELAIRVAFRLEYSPAAGQRWWLSFRGDPDTESVVPLSAFDFVQVPGLSYRFPRAYLEQLKRTQAELWPWAYDPKAPAGSKTAWHSDYDLFWRRLDRPLIREAFLWRHAETPEGIALRYDPHDPSRALPAALLQSRMPPALYYGVAAFVIGFMTLWGLGFFAAGFAFLGRGLPRRAAPWVFIACVASTPLWAPYLVRAARLVGGGNSLLVDVLLHEFTIQKFLGFRLPEPLPGASDSETVAYGWAQSRHTAALGPLALDRGGRTFATDDEAYRALADQLTARTVALGDAELLTLLAELRKDDHEGAELAEPFLESMRVVSLDEARFPAVRRFARTALAATLAGMTFDPDAFARGERLRRVAALAAYPDAKVAERARAFVADAKAYERRAGRATS